jgi:hypothetical protein
MRTQLTLAILATASVASADPLAASATGTIEDAPRTYFMPGVALGSAGNHTMGAVTAELGTRITDHLVIHAEGLFGSDGELLGGSGQYIAATAGVDATSCEKLEKVCAYVGASAGYAYSKYTDSNDWFTGAAGMSTLDQGAVGMLRAGMDIGSTHVRWRPGVEVAVVGPSAAALTQSVIFRF